MAVGGIDAPDPGPLHYSECWRRLILISKGHWERKWYKIRFSCIIIFVKSAPIYVKPRRKRSTISLNIFISSS